MAFLARLRIVSVGGLLMGALLAGPAGGEEPIRCEGLYGGHLQGIATDGTDSLYWSFTVDLVKTDMKGHVLTQVKVPTHHGDLAYQDGKIFVAVNLGRFNREPGHADSWVYIYDAKDLSLLEKHEVQEAVHGAGGMDCDGDHFLVVGGLPESYTENYVYEYDADWEFVKRHVVASGHTHLGIQTAFRGPKSWWFGCYGDPRVTLKADADLAFEAIYEEDFSLGVAQLADGRFLRGHSGKDESGKQWWGRITFEQPGQRPYVRETETPDSGSEE